jgi:hypothetical protein
VNDSFNAMRISSATRALRQLESHIQSTTRHVRFCQSSSVSSKRFDARLMLEMTNKLELESRTLANYLNRVLGEGTSASRAIGTRPPTAVGIKQFSPNLGGQLVDLQALSARLPGELKILQCELSSLGKKWEMALKDPLRTPTPADLAAPDNFSQLIDYILGLIDNFRSLKRES